MKREREWPEYALKQTIYEQREGESGADFEERTRPARTPTRRSL